MALSSTSAASPLFDADIPTLIAAWEGSARDFLEVAEGLDDTEWSYATSCPGWTVGDIVAHVAGVDRDLAGDAPPTDEPDWEALPHVNRPFSRFTELRVAAARGTARADVVESLADVIERRTQQLQHGPTAVGTEVAGLGGSAAPLDRVLRLRAFDTWVHEQDIRRAVGRPGHLATVGARITADNLRTALPLVVGKKAGAEPGESVHLVVTGPIAFTRALLVDPDGRARFVPSGPTTDTTGENPTTRLTLAWETYMLLGCGRVDVETVTDAVDVDGDADLADRVLAAMSIAP